MSKFFIWAILLCPFCVTAQDKGISFVHNLTWTEILRKAKEENKYIFIDFYTTWCGPCKSMDRHVYINDSVGDLINQKFISVKLQMDSTASDNTEVRRLYKIAHELGRQYQIRAYPSFVFFSPDGHAVHKAVGGTDVAGFIKIVRAATNPQQQFYTMLSAYQQGNKNYEIVPLLANAARNLGEDSLTLSIARDYMHNYLLKLADKSKIWTKSNIDFINTYKNALNNNKKLVRLYFENRKVIDSVVDQPNYADRLIDYIVYNEEIDPWIKSGLRDSVEPDWREIEKKIKKQYGPDFVERNLVTGEVAYFKAKQDWKKYIKHFVREVELADIQHWPNGNLVRVYLNNDAFEVFKYSEDKKELEEALSWIDKAISMESTMDPNEMDTKANILYKLGQIKEGLALEEQSHNLAPKDKTIEESYEKMQAGKPTWPIN